jgi:hypothetical protein
MLIAAVLQIIKAIEVNLRRKRIAVINGIFLGDRCRLFIDAF